jgi:hypothetical protein
MAYRKIEQINAAKPSNSRLTAIEYLGTRRNKRGRTEVWIKCVCQCGSDPKEMVASKMVCQILSCGCLITENNLAHTPLKYNSIQDVIIRKPEGSILTPIEFIPRENDIGEKKIRCKCECGKITETRISSFICGKCRSCGCLLIEAKKRKKYKGSVEKIYRVYRSMRNRCLLKTNKFYKNYGAKGIKICDEWLSDYQIFLDWALANGWKRGLQLDKDIKYRLKFPESKIGMLYCPEYCQFITPQENNDTRSNSRYFMYKGKMKTCKQISEITGLDTKIIYRKLNSGNTLDNYIKKTK